MLIWGRKVFEGMKICFNCITWDCVMILQSNANQCWVTWHYFELLSLALYSCMIFLPVVVENRSCWENDAGVAKLKNVGTKRYCCVNNCIASDLFWFALTFQDASETWKKWAFFAFWKPSYPYITAELL